jgi:hypothetical protein
MFEAGAIQLYDPLALELPRVIEAARRVIEVTRNKLTPDAWSPSTPSFGQAMLAPSTSFGVLSNFQIHCLNDPDGGVALSHILTHFGSFESQFDYFETVTADNLSQLTRDKNCPLPAAMLTLARAKFDAFKLTAHGVTPSQLSVQAVFENLVMNGPKGRDIGPGVRFTLFRRLQALRDEYFVAPTPALLAEFLEAVRSIYSHTLYRRYSETALNALNAKIMTAEIERHMADLEVHCLLSTMEASP